MNRFYINEKIEAKKTYELSKEESQHAIKVLRLEPGDAIEILDGKNIFIAKIASIENKKVYVEIIEELNSRASLCKINIFQGLPKSDKLSSIVQKCCEVGVNSIYPVAMVRSVKKIKETEKLVEKMQKTAIEACKQCGLNRIPRIKNPEKLYNLKNELLKNDIIILAYENEKKHMLASLIKGLNFEAKSIAIVIGPEGGIDESEYDFLLSIGAKCVSLGKRIMRTETVAAVMSYAIFTLLEDL